MLLGPFTMPFVAGVYQSDGRPFLKDELQQ
jgi:hypothetical protein